MNIHEGKVKYAPLVMMMDVPLYKGFPLCRNRKTAILSARRED